MLNSTKTTLKRIENTIVSNRYRMQKILLVIPYGYTITVTCIVVAIFFEGLFSNLH